MTGDRLPSPDPLIRDATLDDLPAIRAILTLHGNDGPIVVADVVGPYISHLIGRGRTRVAEDDGQVVGFGAAIDAGRAVHLADLFIHPKRLGQGIGRRLLEAVMAGADRRTTFASDDPRAMPIYIRAGMTPLWPSFYVQGSAAGIPAGPGRLAAEDATPDELAAIELTWTGHDRAADHAHWAAAAQADSFVVRDGHDVVAIGHARVRQMAPVRVVNRLLIHPDADPIAATLTALARTGRHAGEVLISLLGPNPILRPLLESGFRIVEHDQFLASHPDLVDASRLIPNSGML